MIIIKWLLGIIFAFTIVTGLVSILAYADGFNNYVAKNQTIDLIYHFVAVGFIFFVLILFSVLFVPAPKKIAIVISSSITYSLVLFVIYYQLVVIRNQLHPNFYASIVGCSTGLILGILVSYKVFKNKGWNKTETKNSEIERYLNS